MNKICIIAILLCTFLTKANSKCENNDCYRYYHNLTILEKDHVQEVFNGILDKYGDINAILKNLLTRLNNTIFSADQNLTQYMQENNYITNLNNETNHTLINLINNAILIENEMDNINTTTNWPKEIEDANKTANIIISVAATMEDIQAIEKELENWKEFLRKFDDNNYPTNILNIPYSVSDDLNFLETVLTEEYNTSCVGRFYQDLKNLYKQLADTLNVEGADQTLSRLKSRAQKTKDKAEVILSQTIDFLRKENDFKNIHNLTNETLILAKDIEELKNNIDRLLKNNEEIFDNKLKELQKVHEQDLEELYKKYKTSEYHILLDELEDVNTQIVAMGDKKDINIADLEKEIELYMDDIEYYSCILSDCRYRKPAEAITSFNCTKKNT